MDCTPADLFSGRVVRSNTPASARRTIDLAKARKQRLDDQLRIRKKLGRGRHSLETFVVGDRVRLQNPKSLRWSVTGTVTRTISHQGADRPSSYEVSGDEGGSFLRNGRYMRLREQQADTDTEPECTGDGSKSDEPENSESDESRDPRDPEVETTHNSKQTGGEYKQSEVKGTVYRQSPRLKKQCRVTYKEDRISGLRNVQKGSAKGSSSSGPSPSSRDRQQ